MRGGGLPRNHRDGWHSARREAIEIFLRLLGPFSVRRDGQEVAHATFGGRLPQALLRLLATRRGALVPRDVLVDALWPRQPPADPAANLNVLASRIRSATKAPWLVTAAGGGYLLPGGERCVIDAERFMAEVADGVKSLDTDEPADALRTFEAALARWIGEPIAEDLYADWAQHYRRLLHQERRAALEGSAAAALETGDLTLALRRAEQAVEVDHLRESAHLLRVRALAAQGDPAGAADAYATFARQLAAETGLSPSSAARSLHARLLRGELTTTEPRAVGRGRRTVRITSPPEIPGHTPFVGHERELAAVLRHLERPAIVGVAGASGAGKSRLLAEVARRVNRPVLAARAFLAERDEAWSLAGHLLRESLSEDMSAADHLPERIVFALADLLPDLAEIRRVPTLALEPDSRRALTIEGALRLIAARNFPVLLLDDLQWADATSIALLGRIHDRLPQVGMTLAYRDEELPQESPLRRLLADARGPVLAMGPFDAVTIGALVAGHAVAAALAEHTDGTPMAVFEVIRALAQEGLLVRPDGRRWSSSGPRAAVRAAQLADAGQRRTILSRVADQPGAARELLRTLALLGRETPAGVLAAASGKTPKNVLSILDNLARFALVRLGERGWATSHDLVADAITSTLDPAAAGALHTVLAQALIEHDADQAEIARHLAGAGDIPAAAAAYETAAAERLERFANEEAQQLATAGLRLSPRPALQTALLQTRAEARARAGDLPGAGDDLQAALRTGIGGATRGRLLARRARLAAGSEDLARAGELVQLALSETAGEPAARAAALYAGGLVDMNTDRPRRAERRWDEALRLFEQVDDARGMADILDARAMATFLDGRNREAIEAFDRVARLFTDAGDLLRVVTPRSTRGHGLVFLGEPELGLAETEQALELARTLDYPEGVSYALWHRCEALSALGKDEEAERDARQALAIAERVGHRSWAVSALRALGVALHAQGDLRQAENAFRRSLRLAEHWPLFTSWACARIALIRVASGDHARARHYVARALAAGPPLAHYEGRLALAELAALTSEPDAAATAQDALTRAERGGHLVAVPRLAELADAWVTGRSPAAHIDK